MDSNSQDRDFVSLLGRVPEVVFVSAIVFFIIVACLLFSGGSREAPLVSHCELNLMLIGLAMQGYYEEHGCYPPAYVADENGRRLHSWRVLLLPYMDQKNAFEYYDFEKPWDAGSNNIRLRDEFMELYRCPSDSDEKAQYTSYVAITGPGTVFDADKSCKVSDIIDGAENTIMIVEIVESDIFWTEPRDLSREAMTFQVNHGAKDISSNHWRGANVLFCDGHVEFLGNKTSVERLKAMCTIGGQEPLDPSRR